MKMAWIKAKNTALKPMLAVLLRTNVSDQWVDVRAVANAYTMPNDADAKSVTSAFFRTPSLEVAGTQIFYCDDYDYDADDDGKCRVLFRQKLLWNLVALVWKQQTSFAYCTYETLVKSSVEKMVLTGAAVGVDDTELEQKARRFREPLKKRFSEAVAPQSSRSSNGSSNQQHL